MNSEDCQYLVKVFDENDKCLFNDYVEAFCELDAIMRATRQLFVYKEARHAEKLSFYASKQTKNKSNGSGNSIS